MSSRFTTAAVPANWDHTGPTTFISGEQALKSLVKAEAGRPYGRLSVVRGFRDS